MPEEFYEVVYINFDKAILCGRVTVGKDANGYRTEADLEQVLTAEQKRQVEDMNSDHRELMNDLLASFVDRDALITALEKP